MGKIVIFGAGRWGDIAYHYYKTGNELIAYVDNNKELWHKKRNGIEVLPPECLKDIEATVVIANAKYEQAIKEQLLKEYGITYALIFRVVQEAEELNEVLDSDEDELIVSFMGGLGNQMFQYALYKTLEQKGKKVRADLLHYLSTVSRDFELIKVFPKTKIQKANGYNIRKYKTMAPYMDGIVTQVYLEPNAMEGVKSFANEKLLSDEIQYGYLKGYFQTRVFPQIVEKKLREEFVFSNIYDKKLEELTIKFREKNVVSIHVRRGDYLKFPEIYGNICTDVYYQKAINIIKKKVEKPIFCFLSNDIKWVKDNYIEKNAIYIEETMFDEYYDWYDIYIMSLCKHNIIANSSFSWWGAWLNKNPDKIVIAPKRWVNAESMYDICPSEWMRL